VVLQLRRLPREVSKIGNNHDGRREHMTVAANAWRVRICSSYQFLEPAIKPGYSVAGAIEDERKMIKNEQLKSLFCG